MNHKTTFLKSLNDEQLGVFHAHEYSDNLEEILQDHINAIQFELFMKWKNNEMQKEVARKLDDVFSKLDNTTALLATLTERMNNVEHRLGSVQRVFCGHDSNINGCATCTMKQSLNATEYKIFRQKLLNFIEIVFLILGVFMFVGLLITYLEQLGIIELD